MPIDDKTDDKEPIIKSTSAERTQLMRGFEQGVYPASREERFNHCPVNVANPLSNLPYNSAEEFAKYVRENCSKFHQSAIRMLLSMEDEERLYGDNK